MMTALERSAVPPGCQKTSGSYWVMSPSTQARTEKQYLSMCFSYHWSHSFPIPLPKGEGNQNSMPLFYYLFEL